VVVTQAQRKPLEASDRHTLFEPYRWELQLHCYRLLGSLHDAEDLVQETMLRAWQRFDTFKGASSLRTWLYSIATHACLDALKKRQPRTLPLVADPTASDPAQRPAPALAEALWLEPYPDSWLAQATDNPESRYTRSESVSLAFLTVLQFLPPRQRAILLLSDVLDWRASEVAELLELTVSAVNSALFRARATLAQHYHPDGEARAQDRPVDAATSTLLARYVQAWETDDIAGLVALLKEDATFSMPPFPTWYRGPAAVRTLLTWAPFGRVPFFGTGAHRQWRLCPTMANGQSAFAAYRLDPASGSYRAWGIHVLTYDDPTPACQIADLLLFQTPALVTSFGFPPFAD